MPLSDEFASPAVYLVVYTRYTLVSPTRPPGRRAGSFLLELARLFRPLAKHRDRGRTAAWEQVHTYIQYVNSVGRMYAHHLPMRMYTASLVMSGEMEKLRRDWIFFIRFLGSWTPAFCR